MLDATTATLMDDVQALGEALSGELDDIPTHHGLIAALYDRCSSNFGAVRVLIRHGFAHEAVGLTRGLFTGSLVLQELASVDERRRVEMVIGWQLKDIAEHLARLGQMGSDEGVEAARREGLQEQARLATYARRHGASVAHWSPNEDILARRHGRSTEVEVDYKAMHLFVHLSSVSLRARVRQVDERLVIGGPGVDRETWGRPAAFAAAHSYLHALDAACRVLGMAAPDALPEVRRRLDAEIQTISGE